jgi:hypothetical protein
LARNCARPGDDVHPIRMTSDPSERQFTPIETIGTLLLKSALWLTERRRNNVFTGVKGTEPSFGYRSRRADADFTFSMRSKPGRRGDSVLALPEPRTARGSHRCSPHASPRRCTSAVRSLSRLAGAKTPATIRTKKIPQWSPPTHRGARKTRLSATANRCCAGRERPTALRIMRSCTTALPVARSIYHPYMDFA